MLWVRQRTIRLLRLIADTTHACGKYGTQKQAQIALGCHAAGLTDQASKIADQHEAIHKQSSVGPAA